VKITGPVLTVLLAAAAGALIVGSVIDAWKDRGHAKELAELNNQIAAAETTRQVEVGMWMRRMFVVTEALRFAEIDKMGLEKALEKMGLDLRAVYNVAVSYRAQLSGATSAVPDSAGGTTIPINLADGSAHAEGAVNVRGHRIPATAAIDVALSIWIDQLLLSLAIGEAEDGSLTAVAKTADPHVTGVEIEGITDLRTTGLGAEKPSRAKWFGIGGGLGALACLFWCPD
jgi:hypothetical protein